MTFESEPTTAPAAPAGRGVVPLTDVARFTMDQVLPTDRVVILTALRDALDQQLREEKERITANLLGAEKNQSLSTSHFGDLTFIAPRRPVVIDEAKLLEYVRAHAPEAITVETREVIDPQVREAIVGDLVDVGDGMFVRGSGGGGEVVDFATLGEERKAQLNWPASRQQKLTKAHARRVLGDFLPVISQPLLEADAAEVVAPRQPQVEAPAGSPRVIPVSELEARVPARAVPSTIDEDEVF